MPSEPTLCSETTPKWHWVMGQGRRLSWALRTATPLASATTGWAARTTSPLWSSTRALGAVAGVLAAAVAMGAAQFAAGLGVPQSSPVFAVGQAADATGYTQTAARVQPTRTVLLATLPHKSPSAAPESRSATPESQVRDS